MSKVTSFSTEIGGRTLTVEVGKFALQAQASCTVRYGDTVILATAVQAATAREGIDYFPLMVDYEERLYAAGKIKGSRFIKREGRPTDEAILKARLIDRSLRPLFKDTERRDVQVVVTVLSVDQENDPDTAALIGASLVLAMSPIAWGGPLSAVRVGRIGGEWVINPSYEARTKSELDIFVSVTQNDVVMIESGANEVPEDVMFEAISFAHKHASKLFPFINEVITACGQPKAVEPAVDAEVAAAMQKVRAKVEAYLGDKFATVFSAQSKNGRRDALVKIKSELDELLKADNDISKDERATGLKLVDEYLDLAARKLVFDKGVRIDGRSVDEIRPLSCEVGLLPRTHGTGLFQRGETQVLSVVTLGSPSDEQTLDGLEEDGKKRFMHHYNFPGFSVGEAKPQRGPGRREIGHGALAEKALIPVIPKDKEKFPYTIRVVSEVFGSNGSSSQASVCGSSLALMDAGVPIIAPVAGVAMGIVVHPNDQSKYIIITDVQDIEDHVDSMDFKVAGTRKGITAIQLDIKLPGISLEMVKQTLKQACAAHLKILDVMQTTIAEPRAELNKYAPRITSFMISVDKIRDVIGPGGKMINEIIDATGVTIDIEDDGLVMVTATDAAAAEKAVAWIKNLTREVQVGEEFEGTVTRLMNFGAFVEVLPKQEGLVHISELSWNRVGSVEDVVKVGDKLKVKVVEIDSMGRLNLSHKRTLPAPDGYVEESRGNFDSDRPQRSHRDSGGRGRPRR